MATKIYGVDGQREAILTIPLGNGRNTLQIEFKRGNNQRGAYYRPATHVAASEAEQAMIESSPLFKTGMIRLVKTIETEEDRQKKENPAPARQSRGGRTSNTNTKPENPPTDEGAAGGDDKNENNTEGEGDGSNTVSIPEVKTIEEARVALKAHGANAGVLMNETAMKNYMAKNGIVFPNFEF